MNAFNIEQKFYSLKEQVCLKIKELLSRELELKSLERRRTEEEESEFDGIQRDLTILRE